MRPQTRALRGDCDTLREQRRDTECERRQLRNRTFPRYCPIPSTTQMGVVLPRVTGALRPPGLGAKAFLDEVWL